MFYFILSPAKSKGFFRFVWRMGVFIPKGGFFLLGIFFALISPGPLSWSAPLLRLEILSSGIKEFVEDRGHKVAFRES
jgi:hypothetical protein